MGQAALVVPVSGPYTAQWNSFSLGTQNDDGYVLRGEYTGQPINQSDAWGMTLVEAIWRGINWRLQFTGLEWNKPGILAVMQAFGSTGAPSTTWTPSNQSIGDRYSKFAQALTMASILGTYPPTMPTTFTAMNAIIAPNSNIQAMLTSKAREAPLELVLLPYNAVISTNNQVATAFTTT